MNYAKHYDKLIERARLRNQPEGYFERHHAVPRCLGGSDEPNNLVALTAEEHYVAHQLLVKMNPGVYKVAYSALMMTRGTNQTVRSNKLYKWLKQRFSEDCSEFQKERFKEKFNHPCFGKFGKDHPRFGKPHSEESKAKISAAHKGKLVSAETKEKMSESMKVSFNTPEFKAKISAIRKVVFSGEKNPAYGTVLINNGQIRKRVPKDSEIPTGWKLGGVL